MTITTEYRLTHNKLIALQTAVAGHSDYQIIEKCAEAILADPDKLKVINESADRKIAFMESMSTDRQEQEEANGA